MSAVETWNAASGSFGPGARGMMTTVSGWSKNWWFWVIIALAVLSVILFIWAVVATSKKNELQQAADEATNKTTGSTSSASSFRRRKAGYMPEPGVPARKMLSGSGPSTPSGYVAGMGQEPVAVLRTSLRS